MVMTICQLASWLVVKLVKSVQTICNPLKHQEHVHVQLTQLQSESVLSKMMNVLRVWNATQHGSSTFNQQGM